jgi:hypothetical protein
MMKALAKSFAAGGVTVALLLGASATEAIAQDGFDNGSLTGVYSIYTTDSSNSAILGVLEFDGEGGIVAGTATLVLPGETLGPLVPLTVLLYDIVPFDEDDAGDTSQYQVNPDGSGTGLTVAMAREVVPPELEFVQLPWSFVITVAKNTGVAQEYRWVNEVADLAGEVSTGYGTKLPAGVIPSLPAE